MKIVQKIRRFPKQSRFILKVFLAFNLTLLFVVKYVRQQAKLNSIRNARNGM